MKNSRKTESKNVIGEKVRYYRKLNNYTYSKLSDELMLLGIDIPLHSIYDIEKGKRAVVDYEICRLGKMFSYYSKRFTIRFYRRLKQLKKIKFFQFIQNIELL